MRVCIFHSNLSPLYSIPSRTLCLNASLTRYKPLSRGDRIINKTANETLNSALFSSRDVSSSSLMKWVTGREDRQRQRKMKEKKKRKERTTRGYVYHLMRPTFVSSSLSPCKLSAPVLMNSYLHAYTMFRWNYMHAKFASFHVSLFWEERPEMTGIQRRYRFNWMIFTLTKHYIDLIYTIILWQWIDEDW